MLPVLRMVTVGAVLAVVLPAIRLSAQVADPVLGTWELNPAKSRYSPGPPPKSEMRTYEASGQGVKLTVKGLDADGKPTLVQYTANYDGKDYPVTGSQNFDTIVLKRIDAFTLEATLKKAGKVVQTTTRVISKDGKTMTFTVKGTNANGQPFNNVLLWDKR